MVIAIDVRENIFYLTSMIITWKNGKLLSGANKSTKVHAGRSNGPNFDRTNILRSSTNFAILSHFDTKYPKYPWLLLLQDGKLKGRQRNKYQIPNLQWLSMTKFDMYSVNVTREQVPWPFLVEIGMLQPDERLR